MNKANNLKVEIIDKDHIFVNNKQFISLSRLAEIKKDNAKEMNLLTDKNKKLVAENEALRILLKNQLNTIVDDSLTETHINKVCESEDDHEWECCGVFTGGSRYRCKKCFTYKSVPYSCSTYSTTSNI